MIVLIGQVALDGLECGVFGEVHVYLVVDIEPVHRFQDPFSFQF
jgi:hypothetical protein